ncbi:fibronectin type III domain-containing protein [Treponema sp. OMZ 787]|uniref:fibronectin type III domain-containing protein n=1 Tax=Treponema sp. OMZ 787 TaxID=2563669 RepID=UPI0020A3AFA7|nr:fibronectin type III domain-containing protein [Treponema sp. OMZ 787]UTC62443.1 fibronectin type III domain-containing protein [Treponema sp. OMZ 787]
MHQYYENMSYDPVKKYVEVSSYTDIKTGKVLCFELRVFFGNFLETFEDSFWYAKSVTFNPSFTRDIDNNIPVNFGIPLGNAEDDDAAIIALRAKAQHGNKQVNISWDKIDIVKNVKIEWRKNNEEKSELIEAGTTNVTITGLENYRNYTFTVVFLDKEGKEIKKTWISATPRTGDDQKDFAQEPADFVNDKAHLLLKPEFKIDKFMHYPKEKFSFSKSNNDFNFEVPKYFSGEDELGYTDWDKERLKKDKYQLIWRRMAHVLKYGDHYPSQSAYANNGGGNVRWLLYLADFLNLYKQKFPGMVDLKNAPEWFIQLMNSRKPEDSFAKTDEELQIASLNAKAEPGNKKAVISWTKPPAVKKVEISWWPSEENTVKTFEGETTVFEVAGLENYKNYYFTIKFVDNTNKLIKEVQVSATPRTGNDEEDFAQDPKHFVNDQAHRLLKPEYRLDIDLNRSQSKFYFSIYENGINFVFPGYSDTEDILGYTPNDKEEFEKNKSRLIWLRLQKILKSDNYHPSNYSSVNNRGGNVRWLLYLADFLNLYKDKLPGMVDLDNAPEWFIQLMNNRKGSNDSYINDIYKN